MTTDLASSGNIVLDPILPFGLIKTTAKTMTWRKEEYSSLVVKTIESLGSGYNTLFILDNLGSVSKTTGVVIDGLWLAIRFKAGAGLTHIRVDNVDGSYGIDVGYISFYLHRQGDTTYRSNNTLNDMFIRNLTKNESVTCPKGQTTTYSNISENDEIEIEFQYPSWPEKPEVKINSYSAGYCKNVEIVSKVSACLYHDGSLTSGDYATVSFPIYDSDGSTVLTTIEIEAVVSPYSFGRHDVYERYKAGAMKSIVAPVGTWSLKSGATGVYARLRLDSVKVGGVEKTISDIPNLFDTLEIDFMHKDEYENIVAMPVCELITGGNLKQSAIPFESADEELPDGKGGNCAVVVYVKPLRVSDILGKRVEIATSLWIVM